MVNDDWIDMRQHQERRFPGHHFYSDYVAELFNEVWAGLPELDQAILCETLAEVTDDPIVGSPSRNRLGSVCTSLGEKLVDGVGCVQPEQAIVFLDGGRLTKYSKHAAKAVIAHELAHIVLRHHCFTYTLALVAEFRAQELQQMKDVHEWEAHLQAWIWGFYAELRSLWEETDQDPPPWYHQFE